MVLQNKSLDGLPRVFIDFKVISQQINFTRSCDLMLAFSKVYIYHFIGANEEPADMFSVTININLHHRRCCAGLSRTTGVIYLPGPEVQTSLSLFLSGLSLQCRNFLPAAEMIPAAPESMIQVSNGGRGSSCFQVCVQWIHVSPDSWLINETPAICKRTALNCLLLLLCVCKYKHMYCHLVGGSLGFNNTGSSSELIQHLPQVLLYLN